ncbi:MAG: hypothetical protein EPO28_05925 [Saprospiraceae bacterium]|nr:MAG: hypothetical protein EPO28_05925 [Saprospiraceae bacterium]
MKSAHLLLSFASLTLASCQGIPGKDPLGTLGANSFFKTSIPTVVGTVQAVNAVYEPLLFNNANNNF